MSNTENAIPIEAWNTVLFDKFCRFRNVLTHGLSDHSEEFFKRNTYPKGGRILDIGCGFGDTTQQIAKQVGPSGAAVGEAISAGKITLTGNRQLAEDVQIWLKLSPFAPEKSLVAA